MKDVMLLNRKSELKVWGVKGSLLVLTGVLCFLMAWQMVIQPYWLGKPVGEVTASESSIQTKQVSSKVQLHHYSYELEQVHGEEGVSYIYLWKGKDGSTERLTPEQHAQRLYETKEAESWIEYLFLVFNITGWLSLIWVVVGFGGQILFTGRMVVQWLVSEKKGQSVVPPLFWWMSLGGASMLIIYFIWRKDIVGVLGQSTGWFIYVRNIWLIYKPKSPQPTIMDDPGPEPELGE